MKPILGMILATSLVANVGLAAPQPPPRANWPPSANTPPFRSVEESTNVTWLESIAQSLTNAQTLGPRGGLGGSAKDLRTAAYARLGALATVESLAAVERIERQARGQSIVPRTVPLGVWAHPSWHFADSKIAPLAQARTPEGRTYGIVVSFLLGAMEPFLISTAAPEDPTSWSRPLLVPGQGQIFMNLREARLTSESDELLKFDNIQETSRVPKRADGTPDFAKVEIQRTNQHLEIQLAEVLRDTDQDGWTNLEEERLGLDPNKSDTDGDGLADGMDPCPNYAPAKGDETNEDVLILQKAVFAAFGLSGSRQLLLVGPNSPKVQIWGYAGPIIFQKDTGAAWREKYGAGGLFVTWEVTRTGDEARVRLSDYVGPTGGGSQFIQLKRIQGKWIVVGRQFGGVA